MSVTNAFAGPELDLAVLTDPLKIIAYKKQVADQMNAQSGGPRFVDLSERIADMHIETSAQGASILELDLIDPFNLLGNLGFITTDSAGLLYPPIEINFPQGQSDAWWRLCAFRPSSFHGGPNSTLTFEDRAISALRDTDAQTGGVKQSGTNETLAGFIERMVKAASKATGVPIRFVARVSPSDPNYAAPLSTPASYNLPRSNASTGGRANPNKTPQPMPQFMQDQVSQFQTSVANLFGGGLTSPLGTQSPVDLAFADVEGAAGEFLIHASGMASAYNGL